MRLSTAHKLVLFFFTFLVLSSVESKGQCGFTANQRIGCKGYVLNLQDTTTGSVNTNWVITFSNNTSYTTNNNRQASRIMSVCGRVKVAMTTTVGGVLCTKVDSNFLVSCPPVIRGSFNQTNACVGENICYLDATTTSAGCGPLRYYIDWGQGLLDTVPGCRTYTLPGSFNPSVIVIDACGCRSDTTFSGVNAVHVNAPPVASFTGNPLNSCATPLTSVMTATPGNSATIYKWYINGSGVPAQSGHSNVFSHSYAAGTYSIKLITTDSVSGCSDTMLRSSYVTVGNYPAACYTTSVSSGCAPKRVTYCSCSPGALSYVWSFPGGTPSSTTSLTNGCVNVTYATAGSYSSSLIVYYNGGCIDTLRQTNNAVIGQPYTLGITSPDTFSCVLPDLVHLIYTGQPCPSCTFAWSPPGNSTPSSHTGTTVTLNSYQNYSPTLRVTDTLGCTSTLVMQNYIKAQALKAKDSIFQIRNGCLNDTFLVVNTTLGAPFSSVSWSFPGGTTTALGRDSVYVKYPASGCHNFTLIVQTVSGCIDTLRDTICVTAKPVVNLSVTPQDVCYEQLCNNFTATIPAGTDTPSSIIIWPEGLSSNVTTEIVDTPGQPLSYCYMYHNIGTFLACFVPRAGGCVGDTTCLMLPSDSVHIKAPAAKIKKILSCTGSNSVTFVNQSKFADSIVWNIDGNIYINRDSFSVPLNGLCGSAHYASLTAWNFMTGCIHSKSDTFTMPCTGVDFTAVGSRKGCPLTGIHDSLKIVYLDTNAAPPIRVVWDVNSNNAANPRFNNPAPNMVGPAIAVNLLTTGSFKVCVQLIYANGCIDTLCKTNYLNISAPRAVFTVSDTAGCSPFNVRFTNTSVFTAGMQDHFIWSFGDSSQPDRTTVSPVHTYTGVYSYIASLTVVDTNGCSSIATKRIVSNIVDANFTLSDTFTCRANPDTLNPITFTNSSTGYVAHYQWIMPASLGATNPNPGDVPSFSSRFTQQGSGDVCLVATDQYNICHDTICKRITVRDPVADYTFANLADTFKICPIAIVNPFIDLSTNDICRCYWDFGDGSHFDTTCDASHIYTRPGTYPVTHIVTSCHGCIDTIVKYTMHLRGPRLSVTADKKGGCPCTPITLFISSYDADSLEIHSGNGTTLFTYMGIPRGTMANPTLDTITYTYCGVGDNSPYVIAFDLVDSVCRQIYYLDDTLVIDTPTLGFSHAVIGCGLDSVCFSDMTYYYSAHSHTEQRAWDFGDGSPADSSESPCHRFPAPGDYTVSLYVKNNVGCFNTLSQVIHVTRAPQAVLLVDDTIGCVPLLLHFSDSSIVDDSTSIASGLWDFGDGSGINTYTDTSYTYTTANTTPSSYTAMLVVVDGYGCTDTARKQIQVKPTATVNPGPAQIICLGDTATLSASGSPTLHWSPAYNIDTTNPSAPRVWPQVDTIYYLRGGDLPRCYVYDSVRVSVSAITASDTAYALCLGQATTFVGTAQSTHATISSYFWHFGDGATGTGPTIQHIYPVYGTYIDSLVVTNSLGCRDTVYRSIVIGDKPHAALTLSDHSLCLGLPVIVTNSSTPGTSVGLAGFTIDMQSDAVPEFTTSPDNYTYPAVGAYKITLVQADANGCVDTAIENVVVHSNPIAIFSGDSNCILLPNKLTGAYRIGDGGITHYNWTIDGIPQTTSDSLTIHRAFATPGIYNVCFSVSDVFGCTSPDSCNNVTIIAEPTDTIDPIDTTLCLGYSAAFHIHGTYSSIQWVPSTWLDNPNSSDVVATPRQPIKYLVYAYYGQCRPIVDTVSIYVIDSVPVEAAANPENIILGLSSNVTSTVKGTIDSIVWDPDSTLNCRNCRNPIATPKQTTTYTATVYYSKNGVTCSNRASVTVTVITSCDNSLIYVPNTFTPNNDGTNDVFRIRGQGITKVNYFRIYDRWGKIAYEATNVDNLDDAGWNGGRNNDSSKPENSGVFVYTFEIQCITGQTITGKGNVTLIR